MSTNQPLKLGRRHFLTGVGGFTLAIPFLDSLETSARADSMPVRPRYFYLGTDHGGCWDWNLFPKTATPTKATVLPGHTVSSGALAATLSGGNAIISPTLTASGAALTPGLVGKMNVLRGLDVPWYIAHSTGQHLGNFARNDGNGGDGTAVTMLGARPTIDQIMANSPHFYAASDLATTKLRSMLINSGRELSWAFSNPSMGVQSGVQSLQGLNSSLQLFNSIFGGASTAPKTRPPVVDKILANYKSLRQGNSRLSAADKDRLDAHIEMLAELQSSLTAHVACTVPATPTDDASKHAGSTSKAEAAKWGQLFLDVVAAAFACGASRIGVFGWGDTSGFSEYTGNDWHHDVAHQWYLDQPQSWLVQSYQGVFEQALVYLAAKLDQLDDGNGKTVLDNSLLVWSQESGMETHSSWSVPVVTFGSGAGSFNTGLYCDYRKVDPKVTIGTGGPGAAADVTSYVTYPGVLYEQWLATQLLGMGIPTSEFELWKDGQGNAQHGYGTPYVGTESFGSNDPYAAHYKDTSGPYFQIASDPLPFLKS